MPIHASFILCLLVVYSVLAFEFVGQLPMASDTTGCRLFKKIFFNHCLVSKHFVLSDYGRQS